MKTTFHSNQSKLRASYYSLFISTTYNYIFKNCRDYNTPKSNACRIYHTTTGMWECRKCTTAWMQEVEQRMEQLPREQFSTDRQGRCTGKYDQRKSLWDKCHGTTPWQGLFLQSYCISSIPGGQMQEVRVQGRTR